MKLPEVASQLHEVTLQLGIVFRSVDEQAEMQFCESRQLNMSTLRMTAEAQVLFLFR